MKVLNNLCNIFAISIITAVTWATKNYDLEAESLRLYGDDFPSVLQDFRRTTEYVNILSDRIALIKEEIETMGNGLYYHEINSLNLELRSAVSGCELNDNKCEPHSRRSPTAVGSFRELTQSSGEDLHKDHDNESQALRMKKRRTKKQAEDAMKSINFVSTAIRKKALEKYRAVFGPKEKTQPFSLSKAIEDYSRMLRNKSDTATTKNNLKFLNEYPLRKYNKNKYVDIAFKHAKQLIEDVIQTFKISLKMAAGRTYFIDMNE